MKKTFKKLLKPVLTAALALSFLGVMNVSTFADTATPAVGDVYQWINSGSSNDTDVFTVSHSTSSNSISGASITIGEATYTASTRTSTSTSSITINVPSTVTDATFYFVGLSSGSSARTLNLTDASGQQVGSVQTAASKSEAITDQSISGLSQGTYTLTLSGSSAYAVGMLLLEVKEIGEAATTYDYTITGNVSGLDESVTSFKITNSSGVSYDATVASGSYTVTTNTSSDPFDGETFSVTASGYSCDSFTLGSGSTDDDGNVTYTQDLTFVGRQTITTDVYLSANDLDAISYANGTVFGTYFEVYSANATDTITVGSRSISYGDKTYTQRINLNGKSRNIKFTLGADALVQVIYEPNGSGTRNLYINTTANDTETTSNNVAYTASTGSGTAGVLTAALTSGNDYYICSDDTVSILSINIIVGATLTKASSTTTAGAYVNGDNAYVLAAITDTDANTYGTLTLTASGTNSTTTVYDYICVDNFVFAASDVSSASDVAHVYALQLTGATGEDVASDIANVTVSLTV